MAYLKSSRISVMVSYIKEKVLDFQPLFSKKYSIIGVRLGSKYTSSEINKMLLLILDIAFFRGYKFFFHDAVKVFHVSVLFLSSIFYATR